MNKHEEIANTLNTRLAELQRPIFRRSNIELQQRLSADFKKTGPSSSKNQEALEVIESLTFGKFVRFLSYPESG